MYGTGAYDSRILDELKRERLETNTRLDALIYEQRHTNRLLVMLLQALNVPDPTRHESAAEGVSVLPVGTNGEESQAGPR